MAMKFKVTPEVGIAALQTRGGIVTFVLQTAFVRNIRLADPKAAVCARALNSTIDSGKSNQAASAAEEVLRSR